MQKIGFNLTLTTASLEELINNRVINIDNPDFRCRVEVVDVKTERKSSVSTLDESCPTDSLKTVG